ncbi:hypothetical protein BJ165DRAFT_1369666 [Panaeolus papilionaceus]|nr:hypothetical protein BJ165DRAFT_1369666 [Panaeolus papilionaceus]
MSNNHNNWYPQGHGHYQRDQRSQQQQHPQNYIPQQSHDAVQNGQRLLSVYPPASATPTAHVSRHINNITLTAAPIFPQPQYYNNHGSSYTPAQGNPPPYSEYDQQLQYLSSSRPQINNTGYWEGSRNDAVRLLNEQAGPSYQYRDSNQWSQQQYPPSSYQTAPFAQSVFQRTAPSTAYPTPPPPSLPSSTSSSLAFALGPISRQHSTSHTPQHSAAPPSAPPQQQQQQPLPQPAPQPAKVYQPQESHAFFEDFLERKVHQLPQRPQPIQLAQPPPVKTVPARAVTPSPVKAANNDSPDPLALRSGTSSKAGTMTPQKRKIVVEVQTPSKRLQTMAKPLISDSGSLFKTPQPPVPVTPSSSSTPIFKPSGVLQMITPTPKRIVNKAYVSIPPSPFLTPSSSRKGKMGVNNTPDDLGGYGSEESGPSSPTKRPTLLDSVKSSARRTGDRDERGPLEKLTSLIEDIFEAEDTIPSDVLPDDLNTQFFDLLSPDPSRPLLSPQLIRKLTKYIGHVARPSKRLRQAIGGIHGTPRHKERIADVDTQMLSRLLKVLERSIKTGESVDPFVYHGPPVANTRGSPKKPKKPAKGKKTAKSQSPDAEGEVAPEEEARQTLALTEEDYDALTKTLNLARDSILAADCCVALLASDRLTKQLYSEELITSCLNTIKNQLTQIIYPFVEASAEAGGVPNNNPILQNIIKNSHTSASGHRQQLGELFQVVSSVIPRVNNLINAESVAMSDSIIIQAVYIAIGPFFVVDAGGDSDAKAKKDNVVIKTLGKSAMRGLRLDALSLIRSIFANHQDQRSWIIEEILTSLIKLSDSKQKAGQFRLRDGRSIRTVSALLMQLVQTSAHDVRIQARKIEKARQNKFALKRQESFTESQQPDEPFLDEIDKEEIQLYSAALDSATKAAKTIILFLTQRSGKGKATKNSNEAEYRAIFDNLLEDVLVVLFWPEWPAASLILSIASKFMVTSLDDVKTASQTDSNAAKTIALDHLGVIAARIRSSTLKVQRLADENNNGKKALWPLDDILSNLSLKYLTRFLDAHRDVASHLAKRSSEDQAYDSARELTAATLGHEIASALQQVHGWLDSSETDDDLNIKDQTKLQPFGQQLKTALKEVWKDPSTDVFDVGTQEEVTRIDGLAEEIGTIQSLRNSFNPILNIILVSLDAPAIFMRTKALRALGQIVTSDATILSAANVRRGIESHLLDNSPAVRDAAVELIGKYMIDSPAVAGDYYQRIADRIADTGLSVRKRVIKLLKNYYAVIEDNTVRIDIATRLVLRLLDEDDTVKDLAIKTIEELWFPPLPAPSTLKSRTATPAANAQDKTALLSKVAVIMGTSANFKDRQSPLEDVLHKIMANKEGNEQASLHARYGEICEALIDGLVDASDLPGFTVINCIRTIYLLTSAYPSILSGANASTLLPYLKNATSPEELATSDYLLKIFRVSIPHMPKTAAKFGSELQSELQPMIIKPSGGGGVQILQETVGCMCVVVQHLTHDFHRLVNLLKSCNGRLQAITKRPATKEMQPNEVKALIVLIFIVALLVENCNFDTLRDDHSNLASDLDLISQDSITEHIYNTLLTLYEKNVNNSLRARILQCLGFLFRAQPTLMTQDRSAAIMDSIFASPEEEGRGRLLRIIQDFLVSEASKHNAKEKETSKSKNKAAAVNMDELVGNTDGFADSGVSSAIVQRYLNQVLEAALCQNVQIQAIAIDVLSFTIKQGLAHPLQSFPVIIALETSPSNGISNRASALHAILQGKHASLLNTRYNISARQSFEYQKKICSSVVRGFRAHGSPVALLQRWYSHVREKRPARQDFLKSLVKVFQESIGESYSTTQDDVNYTRYMAENFSSFEYKTQEEVLTLIKYLTVVLSTTGMAVLEIVSPSHLLSHLHGPPASQSTQSFSQESSGDQAAPPPSDNDMVVDPPAAAITPTSDSSHNLPLMRTTVIVAMVMLLKAHLKTLYSLSEDKCLKFVIGKKSALGDKPATKRHDNPISWDRLHFATTPLLTSQDGELQKNTFLDIWNEDGVTAEPEEEEFL